MAKKTNKKTDKVDKEDKKKVALFTICSDNLVEVCLTMLFSFLYNNEWFKQEGDIIILCDNNICPLSTDNREKFINLYNNTKFINVDYEFYKPLIEHQEKVLNTPEHFKPVTYKYELFKDYGYEKHVFLDADMIVKNNIKEIFYNSFNFGVCLDMSCMQSEYKTNVIFYNNSQNENVYFNSGMMIIGKNLMNDNIFKQIFNFNLNLTPDYNFKKKLSWKGKMVEQDTLNEIITNYNIIPYETYNHSHFFINQYNYKNTKIIHYCGAYKPWEVNNERYEMAHMFFYKYDFLRKNNIK